MASKGKMEQLMGKAILDPDFRKLLLSDPDAAAKQIRTTLTDVQRIGIKNLDKKAVARWAREFDLLRSKNQGFFW
jgi:hypothetical protein